MHCSLQVYYNVPKENKIGGQPFLSLTNEINATV
jgi:hypothetical protein